MICISSDDVCGAEDAWILGSEKELSVINGIVV
jgi:hypothetical protein